MDRETAIKYTKRVRVSPLTLHLADGQALRVAHRDFLTFEQTHVGVVPEDGSAQVVALDAIVSIEYSPGPRKGDVR